MKAKTQMHYRTNMWDYDSWYLWLKSL